MKSHGGEGPGGLAPALAAWATLLGTAHVITDGAAIARRSATTLPRAPHPLAIISAQSLDEVIGAVRIAAEHRVPLYPVSTGRNWGYGDACPVTEGQVLLELARMNRILEVNEDLAYAVIEPGVTQGQLAAHLKAAGGRLMLDCTGAGPDTSIVGNVLERGFGHTAYGVRSATISGMQVVLADGRVLETGFGHYPAAKAARLYPSGIGPSFDGLFMQSNFGVVTRLGLWLMPMPERVEMIALILDRHEDVAPVVDALRRLRLAGTLRSIAHIGNDLRLISSAVAFPWAEAGPEGLSSALRERLRGEAGVGA
ncbi:MAG: FAD-binding oxidoreductase, partial [Stellaceae bacterium]